MFHNRLRVRNFFPTTIILLGLLLGSRVPLLAQVCTMHLSGHVEDSDTKEKLTLATVELLESTKKILTDERGDFVFDSLCLGTYHLRITHIHCDTVWMEVSMEGDKHIDIFLPHEKNLLTTVTMETKTPALFSGTSVLSRNLLQQSRGMSLSETLSQIPGIVMLQSGTNNAKPVVHGLTGNRVITVNNGIRQEGQQWGNEHAPEIDPFVADKLTLLKGVDALRYGSDAIGGVLLVDTRPLSYGNTKGTTELHTGYFTNNFQYYFSGIHERSFRSVPDLSVRIQSTFKQGGNMATSKYRLNNTGIRELNGSIMAGYRKNRLNMEWYVSRFQTNIGIFTGSHIGNFSDLLQAIQSEQPDPTFLGQKTYSIARPRQEVSHTLAKWKTLYRLPKGKLQWMISGQQNERKEFDIVRSSANTKPQLDLRISTLAEELYLELPVHRKGTSIWGLNGMQQQNVYRGRYFIPNFTSFSGGLYGIYKWHTKQWDLQAGARADHRQLSTTRLLISGDTIDNRFRFTTHAATFFVQHKPSFVHDLSWSIQLGWVSRSPHVNELLSRGIHHGTATFEQGDPSLRIERSLSAQSKITYENHAHTFKMEWNAHLQHIGDFIYLTPRPDSPVLTNAGAFPSMVYQQTDARLFGLDVLLSANPVKKISTELQVSLLRARDKTRSTWLILMPADRIRNSWKYTFKTGKLFKDSYVSLDANHIFKQSRVPEKSTGITDYKNPPEAYTLVHVHAATTISKGRHPISLGMSVRNVFNVAYRDYLNQFRYFSDDLGRNIQIRMSYFISPSK